MSAKIIPFPRVRIRPADLAYLTNGRHSPTMLCSEAEQLNMPIDEIAKAYGATRRIRLAEQIAEQMQLRGQMQPVPLRTWDALLDEIELPAETT